jgi:hypothetical protein
MNRASAFPTRNCSVGNRGQAEQMTVTVAPAAGDDNRLRRIPVNLRDEVTSACALQARQISEAEVDQMLRPGDWHPKSGWPISRSTGGRTPRSPWPRLIDARGDDHRELDSVSNCYLSPERARRRKTLARSRALQRDHPARKRMSHNRAAGPIATRRCQPQQKVTQYRANIWSPLTRSAPRLRARRPAPGRTSPADFAWSPGSVDNVPTRFGGDMGWFRRRLGTAVGPRQQYRRSWHRCSRATPASS